MDNMQENTELNMNAEMDVNSSDSNESESVKLAEDKEVEKEPYIKCDSLVRIYKSEGIEVMALQGLDLEIQKGELMAIIGKSGSGKSTLLNLLRCLDRPSAGYVAYDGVNLNEQEITVKAGEKVAVDCHFIPETWRYLDQEQIAEIWCENGNADALAWECDGTTGEFSITEPGQYKIGVKVNSGHVVAYRFINVTVE